MAKVNLLGVQVDCVGLQDVLLFISSAAQDRRRTLITHMHVMGLNIAYEQAWFRDFMNQSDLVYCDGMGVKLGARLLGGCVPERITLADWYTNLAELAQRQSLSLYLLGNPPGIAERAAVRLRQAYPGIKIAGVQHGFFNKEKGSPENEAVLAQVNASGVDILLVGFGMPAQERWLLENWPRLEAPVTITVGALFEYIAGDLPRGPRWMTQNYLEWLARLLISPGRYWRRYLRDNPLFLLRLLRQKYASQPETSSSNASQVEDNAGFQVACISISYMPSAAGRCDPAKIPMAAMARSTILGSSLTARFLKYFKSGTMNFPELLPAYASAILKQQGHHVTYGRNRIDPQAQIVLLQTSIVDYSEEIAWAQKL